MLYVCFIFICQCHPRYTTATRPSYCYILWPHFFIPERSLSQAKTFEFQTRRLVCGPPNMYISQLCRGQGEPCMNIVRIGSGTSTFSETPLESKSNANDYQQWNPTVNCYIARSYKKFFAYSHLCSHIHTYQTHGISQSKMTAHN
ncbi:hypothetical protein SERLA73DRAFT_178977, partial [Serpula lacrymans var. lacrymans S7.3]